MTRLIVLDTETTGLDPASGHRIIEIGAVELLNRRLTGNRFHQYLNPDREIEAGAIQVHGITNEFLADKARFADIAEDFLAFVRDAELIIHNAPFDCGFINHELKRFKKPATRIEELCTITDTLKLARTRHPGQKNDLDSLCRRYHINNSHRTLHGALLDAEILADVWLAMTGGQAALFSDQVAGAQTGHNNGVARSLPANRPRLAVIHPNDAELAAHEAWLEILDKKKVSS